MTIAARSGSAVFLLFVLSNLAGVDLVLAADTEKSRTSEDGVVPDGKGTPAGKYLLKYQFSPNQFVHYTVEHNSTFMSQSGEVKDVTHSTTLTQKHYRVVATDDLGNATLELMIDRVRMTNQFNDGKQIEFDSQDEAKRPTQFQHVMTSIGKPTARFRFAASGRLLKVISSIEAQRDPCGPRIEGKEDVSDNASRNFLVVFPQKAIRVGDEWTNKFQACVNSANRFQRRVTLLRKYHLDSVKDGEATISMRTSILTRVKEPMIRTQLIQREPKGTILFDIGRGRIVSRESTVDKVVIGAAGPKSSMRAVSLRREKLIRPPATTQNSDSGSSNTVQR